jgi:hypothetical protein
MLKDCDPSKLGLSFVKQSNLDSHRGDQFERLTSIDSYRHQPFGILLVTYLTDVECTFPLEFKKYEKL